MAKLPAVITKKNDEAALRAGIKTPQSLIHIRHNITIAQYKLWLMLVREFTQQVNEGIQPDEKGFRELDLNQYAAFIGYRPKRTEVDSDMRRLKNSDISLNILEKDGRDTLYGSGFVMEWKVSASTLKFKLPSLVEDAARELDNPKSIWQILNWQIFHSFNSKYAAILYKLCKDYAKVGRTPTFTVEKFREYMGLEPAEYIEFKTLNRDVITKSVTQINENAASDIKVGVVFYKAGRTVKELQFTIEYFAQPFLPFSEFSDDSPFSLARVPISLKLQADYLALRTEAELSLCIQMANEYADKQAKVGKRIENYGALYRKSIEEGWHIQAINNYENKSRTKKPNIERSQKVVASKNIDYDREINEVLDRFNQLPEEEKNKLRDEYEKTLGDSPLKSYFVDKKEESPPHKGRFVKFIRQKI